MKREISDILMYEQTLAEEMRYLKNNLRNFTIYYIAALVGIYSLSKFIIISPYCIFNIVTADCDPSFYTWIAVVLILIVYLVIRIVFFKTHRAMFDIRRANYIIKQHEFFKAYLNPDTDKVRETLGTKKRADFYMCIFMVMHLFGAVLCELLICLNWYYCEWERWIGQVIIVAVGCIIIPVCICFKCYRVIVCITSCGRKKSRG